MIISMSKELRVRMLRANYYYRTRMMVGWPGNCSRMPLGNESGRLIDVKQANRFDGVCAPRSVGIALATDCNLQGRVLIFFLAKGQPRLG